uniref:Ion_trans_2 domain-containing protein n=1 Tax=Caenorhabditis tropicalis TaxID=1561998 RepID=A0A1I7UM06_9PELO
MCSQVLFASCYFLLPNIALALFIFFGQIILLRFTSSDKEPSVLDTALFCITTISTIGYGNIVPDGDRAKMISILYCIIGIPLFFLTIATNTVFVIDICRILQKSFTSKPVQDTSFGWYTSAMLLTIHCFIGSLIFSLWIDELDFFDAFYFSFISITTIGYGDFSPSPEGPFQYTVVVFYLCTGVAIMLIFFSNLQDVIMWIHYYGRKVSDSEDAEIWYGRNMITVKDLVKVVAENFGSTPEKLREVMHDLDKILEVACQQAEDVEDDDEEQCKLVNRSESMTSPPASRKKTVFLSGSSDGDDCQATIHSFTSTNQRSIPKDTELAIYALGTIQHHLRKPSVRAKSSHHPKVTIAKPASDNNIESKEYSTSLELRKKAHRVNSDGRLLVQQEV